MIELIRPGHAPLVLIHNADFPEAQP